ncbi:hypothetical protein ZOSMA_3G00990 [Zostera marina]|uniref:Uncharacterized protein n=1 Tax=Zostera marina TaxID=29655 RepID=A0A0K9P3S1_ZOSMR|nr:hypothetical protein ZOSMA_3G00990 [Zostera marina]
MATSSKKRFLKVNRKITPYARNLIHALDATNILPSQQYSYVANRLGGLPNCSFTKTDFFNLPKTAKQNIHSHDVDILMRKLEFLKKEDDYYYYSYALDDERFVIVILCFAIVRNEISKLVFKKTFSKKKKKTTIDKIEIMIISDFLKKLLILFCNKLF